MTPECSFTLPNGRKCRGAALQNQPFCRHHAPQPARKGPAPIAKRNIYTPLAQWRTLGRDLPWCDPSEIPFTVYQILQSLATPGTHHSDEATGRYLRVLLSRLGRVPFPQPSPEEPAPPPPPAPHPALAPAPDPSPSHPPLDNAISPSEMRAALESIYEDAAPEFIAGLMNTINRFSVAPASSSPAMQTHSTRPSHP